MKKRLLLVVSGFIFMMGGFVFLGYIPYQHAYELTHPPRYPVYISPKGINAYENVSFQTSDGLTLRGWYVPPKNGAVVIFAHGRNGNRIVWLPEAHLLFQRGYGVLLFDLRNSGNSEGDITTLGALESQDVLAAMDYVKTRESKQTRMGLVGHSMGTAAALLAAAQSPDAACIVTISAFTGLEDNIADGTKALTGLPPFPFAPLVVFWGEIITGQSIQAVRPIDVLPQIAPRPILFIHGEKDQVVPVRNAHELYEAYTGPKDLYLLPNAGHGDFWDAAPAETPKRFLQFLKGCLIENRDD